MSSSPNEIVLCELLAEREMAIASQNIERLAVLNTAIDLHHKMILEDAKKENKE